MLSWFTIKDLDEHQQNAIFWLQCQTEEKRKQHVLFILARLFKMLCLPYHNPIRHLIVDLIHCLFLSIAHWIVKKLWVNSGKITKTQLEEMEKKVKQIKLPSELKRILNKIATVKGFLGFMTDQ